MDPLSIAGSIAGLISLSDTIFRKLYHYVKDVKSAEKEVKTLKNEIAALNGVLHNLQLIAQDLETSDLQNNSIRLDHIDGCLNTLYKLKENIEKAGIFDKGKIRSTVHKLSWPFKAVDTKKFVDDIRGHRDHLNFALSVDTMAALLQCLSKQDQLLSGVAGLETRLRDKQDIGTKIVVNAERQKILDNFLSVNPEDSFRTNTRIRHTTTGFWLTKTDEFTKWMQGSNSHLWLSGIPGAGKTILSSLIIQHCLKQATDDRAVAFFYCDYKDIRSQDVVQILSSLTSQLARQHESCFQLLKDYDNELRPQHQLRRSPEVDELIHLLRKMSDYFEDVCLIVDGLDECNEQAGEVARKLKSLGNGHAVISMCFLSRDELDIRTELESLMFEHIEIAAHTEDVEHYVRTEIEDRLKKKKLRLKSSDLKDEIVRQLVTRAKGMFRWVSCQLDHLCELPTDALRRKALTCLPATLNETYARVLTRVEAFARPLVRRTLQWITYAHHPRLSVEQLSEIVSVDENDDELDPEACPDLDDLLRYCGSLVRKAGSSNDGYSRLELAHFTVQEFLEAIDPNDLEMNEFRLSSKDTLILARTCLNYLCLPSFDRPPSDFEEDFEDHPFYEHVTHCLTHYIVELKHEENMKRYLQRLFRPPKSYNLTRLILHHLQHLELGVKENQWIDNVCSYGFSSLHAAAMFRFGTVCRWLLDEGCDVNQRSTFGTPLEWVVVGPHSTITKENFDMFEHLWEDDTRRIISTLLEAGAAYDAEGVDLDSLFFAVSYSPSDLLAEMLRHGMPLQMSLLRQLEEAIASEGVMIENFLLSIDDVEHAKIPLEVRVRLLELARTNDVELKASNLPIDTTTSTTNTMSDETYTEAITYAVKYGPVSNLLHLTADKRFSVNMEGSRLSATLLHIAAEYNSPECMELLLDKGFDADYLDEFGRTVLHYTISYGVKGENLLRRLIQSNAAEVVDCDGRGIWHVVAEKGRLDVFDILITELGPDHPYLCMQSKTGRTPLLEAILYRQDHIASRILRSLPTDKTFATDPQIVYSAVAAGLGDLLQELVEMGANLHIRSDQGQSALYFTTQETTPGILRALLDHGLNVDHLDSYGKSPLLDLLEVDQHSQRLQALGYSESDSTDLNLSVMGLFATPFCATAQDRESNSAWLYFCAKTIPHNLRLAQPSKADFIVGLFDILAERGALKAYEEASINSGISSLIRTCLDTVSKASMEDQKTILPSVKAILRHVLEATTSDSLLATHSQGVRLLIWSITQSDDEVCEQLIRLGIDVHAICEHYGEDSAVDIAIERTIGEKPFDMILANADPIRIPKLNANGSMRHFVLCRKAKLTNEGYAIQPLVGEAQGKIPTSVSKLERLLQKGVDPNVRSVHGWTAAIIAAVEGQLECMKLLVAYSADLLLMDQTGWTVIHYAIRGGHLIFLEYCRRVIKQDEEWTRPATFTIPPSHSDYKPLGPLSHWEYHRCSPAHFAAYNRTSDTLQFLLNDNVVSNINAEAQDGVTPLHLAVCVNSPQTTRWLLENGADINLKCGKRKISALHIAMRWGHLENTIALIEAGAEFCADSGGITPGMQVDPAICANLLELLPNIGVPVPPVVMEGIRKRLKIKSSRSLYWAIVNGDIDACSSIIAAAPCFPRVLEECGKCTPLVFALAHQRLDISKLFLDRGAPTNGTPCARISHFEPGVSAVEIATQQPVFNPLLEQLLEQSLLDEIHWSQRFGYWRPFHLAAVFNPGAIKILADHVLKHTALFNGDSVQPTTGRFNFDPSTTLKAGLEGYTTDTDVASLPGLLPSCNTLHVAVCRNNADAVDTLLDLGVGPNMTGAKGFSPLHYAASTGNSTLVEKLLRAGARPNATTHMQITPLMSAATVSRAPSASILFKHGANLAAVDSHGRTALHHAAQEQSIGMFMFFLDSGCDPYQLDEGERSPVYYALSQSHFATYIYARGLDLAHIIRADKFPEIGPGIYGLRALLCYCSETTRRSILAMETVNRNTVFIESAIYNGPSFINICLKAGAQLEVTRNNGDTALLATCRAGALSSVAYLVRNGAKLEYEHQGRIFNAYIAAYGNPEIVKWLLVERWTEQGKLGSKPANSGEQVQCKPWAGVRTVKIPLRGDYERPEGSSLFDHARYLHGVAKQGWRILVPLGWDTVANLVPLPGET